MRMPEIVTVKMFTDKEKKLILLRVLTLVIGVLPFLMFIIIFYNKFYISLLLSAMYVIVILFMYLLDAYVSCKKVILHPMKIEIINGLNFKKVIPINNISDLYINKSNVIFEKSRNIYYVHIVLKNNKHVNLSENIQLDTLIAFLHKFMEYYGDKLTPRCRSSIQEFINQAEGGITNR